MGNPGYNLGKGFFHIKWGQTPYWFSSVDSPSQQTLKTSLAKTLCEDLGKAAG